MDESRISNVQKPDRMIAMGCCRTVGKIISGEQGQAVTVIYKYCWAIYPTYLFARKRVENTLMNAAPPQSMGYATGYGWTNAVMFVRWLKH